MKKTTLNENMLFNGVLLFFFLVVSCFGTVFHLLEFFPSCHLIELWFYGDSSRMEWIRQNKNRRIKEWEKKNKKRYMATKNVKDRLSAYSPLNSKLRLSILHFRLKTKTTTRQRIFSSLVARKSFPLNRFSREKIQDRRKWQKKTQRKSSWCL